MIYGRPLPKSHRKKLLISTYLQYKSKEHSNTSSLILFNHVLHGYWKNCSLSCRTFYNYIVSWEVVFCYHNCSDLLWEKIVLVIEKDFWNSRLNAENLQNFWDHLNNLFKQCKVRTISGSRMLFNLFLEVSHI